VFTELSFQWRHVVSYVSQWRRRRLRHDDDDDDDDDDMDGTHASESTNVKAQNADHVPQIATTD
jgi:hypothetical protein